ncbi:MAG TPA: SLC13 family permease [Marmoricola sp.]
MTADLVPLLALVALIVVAYRHPRWWVEALAAVVAAGAVLTTDALDVHGARSEIDRLGPVVIFLVAILTVAESCRANGLFEAVGARLRRLSGRDAVLGVTFATAAAVTVTLSLDATIVLLTPVVLTATRNRFVAGEMACVCLANSASLLVPVANLTNLLMMPHLHLTFGRFALLMAPSWFVVLIVEFVALRIVARHEPVSAPEPVARDGGPSPVRALPVVVVVLMLAGFAIGSPYGIQPAWIACVAAGILLVHDLGTGRNRLRAVIARAHPSFAVFVLALGLVVAGLGNGWFGDRLAATIPGRTDLIGLLAIAAIGALLANVVNNLPAALLLAPMVAPLGATPVLALLIGINVGSSLTWTGSLANLLWRRVLITHGHAPPTRLFHVMAAATSPVAIVLGVLVLDGWARAMA